MASYGSLVSQWGHQAKWLAWASVKTGNTCMNTSTKRLWAIFTGTHYTFKGFYVAPSSINTNRYLNNLQLCFLSLSTVRVLAFLGDNITLPCQLHHKDPSSFGSIGIRVKWTKVAEDESLNEDVLLSMGFHKKTYGRFEDRVFLSDSDSSSASLIITEVSKEDAGKYHCEIINGMTDAIQEVILDVENGLKDGKCSIISCF